MSATRSTRLGLAAGIVLLAAAAHAVPAVFVEQVECDVTDPVCILVVPDGSGMTFLEARTMNGEVVDASITVQLWIYDEFGSVGPAVGFFAEWLTIQEPEGLTRGCAQDHVAAADHDTDQDGWTTFSLAPRAGGWSQDLLEIYVVGDPSSAFGIIIPPLPVYFNSPDIDGDLTVDLTDVVLFVQDLGSGDAPLRSDLSWDGVLNLSDIVVLTQHLGADCQ